MLSRALLFVALLSWPMIAALADTDPFAQPVKDCQPCHWSPGPGQPTFDITFVFSGTGDQRVLSAIEVKPPSGTAQRLATGDLAVSDFPDGFVLDDLDLNADGFHDLALTTLVAADNSDAIYWIYRPATRDLEPLVRVGDEDASYALAPAPDHQLVCHIRDGMVGGTDYWYRLAGVRAVAIRKETIGAEGPLVTDRVEDLTVTPARSVSRTIIGFSGDSPARTAFLQELTKASAHADALYRSGDKAGAAAALEPLLKDKELARLTASYPADPGDPGDRRIVEEVNNYGFYLAEAGRPADAIGVLAGVVDVAPDRVVAYLNLADAQSAAGRAADARESYAAYVKRMTAAGIAARIPPRAYPHPDPPHKGEGAD